MFTSNNPSRLKTEIRIPELIKDFIGRLLEKKKKCIKGEVRKQQKRHGRRWWISK
jgi:hypothetical protein